MSGPTIRVLSLLELLQSNSQLTGTELARQLGVDKRTVRRYIRVLEDLGVPVTTEQGRDGGYTLVAGFKLPPMMFTNEETFALSLGLLAANNLHLAGTQTALSSVQAKLERVMPAKLKSRAKAVSERISLMFPESVTDAPQPHLQPLLDALEHQRSVAICYARHQQEVVSRRVDPYGLLFRRGHWYMSGYCHLRQELRTFRLDHIQQVELLEVCFEPPEGFNTAEYFIQSLNAMPCNLEVKVVLHADQSEAAEVLGSMAGMLQPQQDGLLLSTRTDSSYWFALWLSQLPFDFTILEPTELKLALKNQAERLLKLSGR
ncbi:transcriptional regulator [Aliidiomarina minuta]|uniref:Transcriptional regulator n=1 Tax=Aliidiomarina minuta TaxID=880057 RepID=A0A432WAA9_9GAMM|nr:YafY family protein [Aliidiomarina minuta]RUO26538.1 transcriptional regulator [Aliidiomarina minuta]